VGVRVGVLVFPGSNCDRDTLYVLTEVLQVDADLIWHRETRLSSYDCLVLPGGFAHGDYLRSGAIARFSPVMRAVERYAHDGGLVWGICNGFQVLVESGLLPGAMLQNQGLRFVCKWVHVRVESAASPLTCEIPVGTVLRLPVAHHEGCYFVDSGTLRAMEAQRQVLLRYCAPDGALTPQANPNGSVSNVAGVCNAAGNVFGLMPHPERCAEGLLGGTDGLALLQSVLASRAELPMSSQRAERLVASS
jgi:phosphoribosylformylglycinamidine synthase